MAALPLLAYLLWYLRNFDPLFGRASYYDGITIDVNGKGKTKTIYPFTPEKYPEDHYIFLPSSSVLSETRIFYDDADVLVLSAEGKEDTALYSGGNLSGIETGVIYYSSLFSSGGELLEKGKMEFLKSSGLPAIYVSTESGSMDNIYEDKDHRERGKIYIEDGSGRIEYMGDLNYIKGHGNTTWGEEKKSLRIMLHRPSDLFNMGASRSWLLMANCLDLTSFQNSIVYDLARNAGMDFTPDMVYADLYLNGRYNGLYQLCERNETGPCRIEITDLNIKNKQANSAIDRSTYDSFVENENSPGERRGVLLPNDPRDITGGYIVEHDYGEKYKTEVSRFRTVNGEKYVLKSPVFASKAEVSYIARVFDELEERLESGKDKSDIIDVESFADKYLIEEIVKNDGAGATSSVFYKDKDDIDPRLHAGPVWDYDMALGNSGRILTDVPDHLDFCTNHVEHTVLFYDLYMKSDSFRETVMKDYREKFRGQLHSLLNGGLEEYALAVDKNNGMDTARWQLNIDEINSHRENIREFLEKRMEFLDRVWIDRENIHIVHLTKDGGDRHPYIGLLDGGTLETIPQPRRRNEEDEEPYWRTVETGEFFDKNTPVYSDLTLISSAYYEEQ